MNTSDLHKLRSRSLKPDCRVLTVYLNVDQSQPDNMNRRFQERLKQMTLAVRGAVPNAAELGKLTKAVHRVSDFVSAYNGSARTLIVISDECDGFLWHTELATAMNEDIRWNRQAFLEPLARALDTFEKCAIVLLDKNNMRLFTAFLGGIDEVAYQHFGPAEVRHIKTAGADHLCSSSRLQRHADEQIRANLRQMIGRIESVVNSEKINRLILAGTPDITAALRDLFPKRLTLRVIGTIDIGMNATASDVLAATQPIADRYEQAVDLEAANSVVTAARKGERAVAGLGHTLKAMNSDRVWELVYSAGFSTPGYECAQCAALFSILSATCHYCGGKLIPVANIVECAVNRAFANGAKIEAVNGEAAEVLSPAGGIAAFLKTRTGRSVSIAK
jgi:peptide subunit release factor 1 (eRF1)